MDTMNIVPIGLLLKGNQMVSIGAVWIEPKFILELNFHGSMMILLMRVGELFHGESQVFCNSKAVVVVVVGF
ncbi:hypothetical protein PRUPE_7G013800 [Prunus persica]|uniref:Uncharacterized protein n=1 Tax=Prunus persica TaxID=3760 RepID=A0A251N4W3_PRUPE|nr:hypothetical protein PRUPE_7G013800 [Prunus persica]